MAVKGESSFVAQLMSGLFSDVDMASIVLNHTSVILFRHINNHGIDSLFENELLERQLDVILSCLRALTCHEDNGALESCEGSTNSCTGRSTSICDICTNLLDSLCCPVLVHLVASEIFSDGNYRMVETVLSIVVPCFVSSTREAQTKMLHVLIDLLSCKAMKSLHLSVVGTLSCLCECPDDGAFDQTTTGDLLTVIENMCLTSEEPFVGRIFVQLVPSILTHDDRREVVTGRLWSTVEKSCSDANADDISRCCFLICGLADVLFSARNASVSFTANLFSSSTLWHCVQKGLQHAVALTRKRAIFILRRALDFAGLISDSAESTAVVDSTDVLNSVHCLCQLSSVWHEVIILFETLEEKQVNLYLSVIMQILFTVSGC